jgi:hypothetical protein
MVPTLPPVILVLEFLCGSVRALIGSVGGGVASQAVWLIAALLPAAYWVAERLVLSSWENSRGLDDGS